MMHGYEFLLLVLMAVGMNVIYVTTRWVWRHRRGAPMSFDRWQDELEHAAIHDIRMALEFARSSAGVVELVGQLPKDFNPAAFLVCNIVEGVYKAVLIKAAEEGHIQPRDLQMIYGQNLRSYEVRPAADLPQQQPRVVVMAQPQPLPVVASAELPPPGPAFVWTGGRLIPGKPS